MAGASESIRQASDWVMQHLGLVVGIGLAIVALLVGLNVLFQWLGSRAQVMLVRTVAIGDARMERFGDHWRSVSEIAWSLFKFRIVLALSMFVFFLAVAAWVVASLVSLAHRNASDLSDYVVPLMPPIILFVLVALAYWLTMTLLRNFVVPLMYRFNLVTADGWREFRVISRGNVAPIIFFLLIRFAYHIGYGFAAMVVGCLTCCLGVFPILHQAIFAPFFVFDRAFSLFLISTLGPNYTIVETAPMPPTGAFPSAPLLDVMPGTTSPPPPAPPAPPSDDAFDNPFDPRDKP